MKILFQAMKISHDIWNEQDLPMTGIKTPIHDCFADYKRNR